MDDPSSVSDPLPIRRLEEALVNKIAAGEIIHRPSSALKELLENSLDAGSTQIKVIVKDGGLKLLQIVDNGCGIRKTDLPILCERFTTSKLTAFSDLQSLTTYGFRGEALASISHVSHLSVITKRRDDPCAWKAFYADSILVAQNAGGSAEPKACAGNDGTTITAEDLFYNMPTRLSSLRSSTDEYNRVLEVVTRYAVHNPTVSFVCKKAGTSAPDVSTPSSSSVASNIKLLFGSAVAKELIRTQISSETKQKKKRLKGKAKEDAPRWEVEAYATSVNYHSKKFIFLLFINHRLVESSRLKRAIDAVYTPILPKGSFPFVYLSLQIDPSQVDVNVHPTKREVHFLDEELIANEIADSIHNNIAAQGESRTFEYQTLLTNEGIPSLGIGRKRKDIESTPSRRTREILEDDAVEQIVEDGVEMVAPKPATSEKIRTVDPRYKIRNSTGVRTLDSMMEASLSSGRSNMTQADQAKKIVVEESICSLASVRVLRERVTKDAHTTLNEIIRKHIFVGIADLRSCMALIQHNTKLFLLNYGALSEELFYQLALRQFGNLPTLDLEPPPSIRRLIRIAVLAEGDTVLESGLSPEKVVDAIVTIIEERRELMDEYFSIKINKQLELQSLPLLIQGFTPNLDRLPQFLMRLGPEVDWSQELTCLEGILRELAFFYRPETVSDSSEEQIRHVDSVESDAQKADKWQVEHVMFQAMREYFIPSRGLVEQPGTITQIANLPDLYRVFERC